MEMWDFSSYESRMTFRGERRGLSKSYLESYLWPLFATELNPQSSAYRMQYASIMGSLPPLYYSDIRFLGFWPCWRTSAWSAVSMRIIILSSISDLHTLRATMKGSFDGSLWLFDQCQLDASGWILGHNVKPRRVSDGLENPMQKWRRWNSKYCSHFLGKLWWALLSLEGNWYNRIVVSATSQRPYMPGWRIVCCLGDWHHWGEVSFLSCWPQSNKHSHFGLGFSWVLPQVLDSS